MPYEYIILFALTSRTCGVPTHFIELLQTYILLFDRDRSSMKIGLSLGIDMHVVGSFRDLYYRCGPTLRVEDFSIYGSRLKDIHTRMHDWRLQSILDLATHPYHDPLTFYGFWFATAIGVIGILGLGATPAQTYASFKGL